MAVKISVCRPPSLRPSLRVVCPASAVRAPRIQTSSRRQMLKMRLMAKNEGRKEGNFAPLIDASVKSEKCSLACTPAFPHSLFLSVPLNQVIQSSISRLPATFLALALHSLETRSSSSTSKCKCLFCSLPPVPSSSSRPSLNRTGPQYSVFPCLLDPFLIFKSYPPVKLS